MSFTLGLPNFSIDFRQTHWQADAAQFKTLDASLRAKFESEKIGFYDWPNKVGREDLQAMKAVAQRLKSEFAGAIVFGIGGSYLGPLTIIEALSNPAEAPFPIYWLSNVDAEEIRRFESLVQKKKLAAIVTSKSGGTVETLSAFFHLSRHLDPKGYVAITDPDKGDLRKLATNNRWANFPVPSNIGGRFSVLTAVGLLPAELAGIDSELLILGAKQMRDFFDRLAPENNPAYLTALAYHTWDKNGFPIQYLMPYQKNLSQFSSWFVQLWAESLGKHPLKNRETSVGFTPVPALGTTDQHSLLQLFKEGPRNKVIAFIDVLNEELDPIAVQKPTFAAPESQRYLFEHNFQKITHQASLATEKSLQNSGVPTYRIEIPKLDAQTLGSLFFFFETACAFAGELYGVDAYDQPGVEETKVLLRSALDVH